MQSSGPREERETKLCPKCGLLKSRVEFYSHAETRDRLYSWCRACHSIIYKQLRALEPEKFHRTRMNTHFKRRYGIDYLIYEKLSLAQNGLCGLCKSKPLKLEVDHNHETGVIRGLLCHKCNTGLGLIGDSMHSIGRIIRYLTGRPVHEGTRAKIRT